MFFTLSKVLWALVLPYTFLLMGVVVLLWRARPSPFRRYFSLVFIAIVVLSTSWGSGRLIRFLEDVHPSLDAQSLPRADVVIVLAGMVNPLAGPGTRPEFLGSLDRILMGEELIRTGRAPKLLISGGSGLLSQAGESEALILERWLIARGMRPDVIITEPNSRNTAENAQESAAILQRFGWTKAILVTSAFHMPRSVLCFRKQGVEVQPFPVDYYASRRWAGFEALMPNESGLATSTVALKELAGIVAYRIRGYL